MQVVWDDQHVHRWRFVKMRTLVDQANEYQKQPRSNSSQAEVGLSYFWDHKEEPCHFVLLCIRFEGVYYKERLRT